MDRTGKGKKERPEKRSTHTHTHETVKVTLSVALSELPGCGGQIVDVWDTHGEERPSGPFGGLGHHLRILGYSEDVLPDQSVLSHSGCRALYISQPTTSITHKTTGCKSATCFTKNSPGWPR